jgi:hypothetical protein
MIQDKCVKLCPELHGKSIKQAKDSLNISQLDYVRKKLIKRDIWGIALYSAETWIFQNIEQTQLASFELWCCKRMKMISWANQVANEEILHSQGEKEHHTITHT